jgi:hypothetical protein
MLLGWALLTRWHPNVEEFVGLLRELPLCAACVIEGQEH